MSPTAATLILVLTRTGSAISTGSAAGVTSSGAAGAGGGKAGDEGGGHGAPHDRIAGDTQGHGQQTQDGGGGSHQDRPQSSRCGLDDGIAEFGVLELHLPIGADVPDRPSARMAVENQSLEGFFDDSGNVRFRFTPKRSGPFEYTIEGNVPSLDGKTGSLTARPTDPDAASGPDPNRPNWWTDDPAPASTSTTPPGRAPCR